MSSGLRSAPSHSCREASPLWTTTLPAPAGAPSTELSACFSAHPLQPREGSPTSIPHSQLQKLSLRAVTLSQGDMGAGHSGILTPKILQAASPAGLFSLASFWGSPSYLPAHSLLPKNNHYICFLFFLTTKTVWGHLVENLDNTKVKKELKLTHLCIPSCLALLFGYYRHRLYARFLTFFTYISLILRAIFPSRNICG